MFAELCQIYFPACFLCVVRLLQHNINNYAHKKSTQHAQLSRQSDVLLKSPRPDPSPPSADAGPTWSLWKSRAAPDREFKAQEGHHIMGMSMRDGKPMGIIDAPMEAIGCCKKSVGSLGDKMYVQNSSKHNKTVNNLLNSLRDTRRPKL